MADDDEFEDTEPQPIAIAEPYYRGVASSLVWVVVILIAAVCFLCAIGTSGGWLSDPLADRMAADVHAAATAAKIAAVAISAYVFARAVDAIAGRH